MAKNDSSGSIDLVLRGGTLVDGTGCPPVQGDLAISGHQIVAIGGRIDAPDAGAHVNLISDGSMPTTQLKHWCGGRKRGEGLPVEFLVEKQTRRNARLYGLQDRGTLEVGMRADVNVIDMDSLAVALPISYNDLPAGGARLLQSVSGYVATILNGVVTRRQDKDSGARPGRLVRGAGARN